MYCAIKSPRFFYASPKISIWWKDMVWPDQCFLLLYNVENWKENSLKLPLLLIPSSLNEKLLEKSLNPKPSLSKAVTVTLTLFIRFALGLKKCYPSWPEDIRQWRARQVPQNSDTQFGVSLQPWDPVWIDCKNSSMDTLISFGKMHYSSINWQNPVSPRAIQPQNNLKTHPCCSSENKI